MEKKYASVFWYFFVVNLDWYSQVTVKVDICIPEIIG